jgi:CHAT domain
MSTVRTDFVVQSADQSVAHAAATFDRLRPNHMVVVDRASRMEYVIGSRELRRVFSSTLDGRRLGDACGIQDRAPTLRLSARASRAGVDHALIVEGSTIVGLFDRRGKEIHPELHDPERSPSTRVSFDSPDLQLVILEERTGGGVDLSFRVTAADPDLGENWAPYGPVTLRVEPSRFFREFYEDLESQRDSSPSEGSIPRWSRQGSSPMNAERRLATKGLRLFREILPRELQTRLWELRARVRTVLLQSEEPWIPWELCKLQGREGGRIVEGPFFAEAFDLGRWQPGVGIRPSITMNNIALVQPSDSGLKGAHEEASYVQSLSQEGRRVDRVAATMLEVQAAMADARHDVWHFTGHGIHCDEDPERSAIVLERGERLLSEDLSGVVGNLGLAHPFVFLNACQIARGGDSLAGLGGWASAFLRQGASAFLGASWEIDDQAALGFARGVYSRLLEGEPIGRAVREARIAVRRAGDPSWLAYALFAHPGAKVLQ